MNFTNKQLKTQDKHWLGTLATNSLKRSGQLWFVLAVLGQWFFALYVIAHYGAKAAQGNLAAWNETLPKGHVPGDHMGNLAIMIHLLLAAVVLVGGPLQFVPQIRLRFKKFHRWNGKIYIFAAFPISLAGFYMTWIRGGAVGDISQHIGISLDGVLIMLFAIFAWRYAMLRDFKKHSQWAFRLFLVMNGVWFFRVGLMFWLIINGGPVGFDPESFTGPFLSILIFADFLFPLAVFEIYLYAQKQVNPIGKLAMSLGLLLLTLIMVIGIFGATMGMWLPRI